MFILFFQNITLYSVAIGASHDQKNLYWKLFKWKICVHFSYLIQLSIFLFYCSDESDSEVSDEEDLNDEEDDTVVCDDEDEEEEVIT